VRDDRIARERVPAALPLPPLPPRMAGERRENAFAPEGLGEAEAEEAELGGPRASTSGAMAPPLAKPERRDATCPVSYTSDCKLLVSVPLYPPRHFRRDPLRPGVVCFRLCAHSKAVRP
jgi:hypothetical protein